MERLAAGAVRGRASTFPRARPELALAAALFLAEQALEQMVRRDGSHPSLAIWSMANECRTDDELGARAMERLLRRAKALDPSRLATYVSNQRQEQNRAFALADLVAVNLYFGMFEEPLAEDVSQIEDRVYRTRGRRRRRLELGGLPAPAGVHERLPHGVRPLRPRDARPAAQEGARRDAGAVARRGPVSR